MVAVVKTPGSAKKKLLKNKSEEDASSANLSTPTPKKLKKKSIGTPKTALIANGNGVPESTPTPKKKLKKAGATPTPKKSEPTEDSVAVSEKATLEIEEATPKKRILKKKSMTPKKPAMIDGELATPTPKKKKALVVGDVPDGTPTPLKKKKKKLTGENLSDGVLFFDGDATPTPKKKKLAKKEDEKVEEVQASEEPTSSLPTPKKVQLFDDDDEPMSLTPKKPSSAKKAVKKGGKKGKNAVVQKEEESDEEVNGAGFGTPGGFDDSDLDDDFGSTDEEGDEDELPIEKQARRLDKLKEKEAKEAEKELQLNIANQEVFELPTIEEVSKEITDAPSLQAIKQRIHDVLQVLGDFKTRHQEGRSRQDYVEILIKDVCSFYGYNEYLVRKFYELFPKGLELIEFLESNDQPRPVTIRANTLKSRRVYSMEKQLHPYFLVVRVPRVADCTARLIRDRQKSDVPPGHAHGELAKSLISRGMNVDPAAEWTKVGLVVYDSQVPVGATPEYLAGHYMIQGLSSLLPVMALAPQPGEKVLDMAAAPGGKTTHIAALMKNTGVLFANDTNMERCRAIIGNLHRLGVNNCVVSNLDGLEYPKVMPQGFDRILLDAPCSGTGVIWKDPSIKLNKTSQDVQRRHTLQRQLILAALDAINADSPTGGYLVYSTCSILPEENEAVVNYALEKRHCKLVPTGLEIGEEGYTRFREYRFHPSLNLTRRYYPHVHNIDGFYVAKIQKLSNAKTAPKEDRKEDQRPKLTAEELAKKKKQKSKRKADLMKKKAMEGREKRMYGDFSGEEHKERFVPTMPEKHKKVRGKTPGKAGQEKKQRSVEKRLEGAVFTE